METDWEFEVGGDAPVIDASSAGFVDLPGSPERAWDLPETRLLPGLGEALIKLNSPDSAFWTSKCDVWPDLAADEFDPDELDAPPGCRVHAMGCYIDLVPRDERRWVDPKKTAAECREICGLLRAISLRCCRADLVIRRAIVAADGCGEQHECLGVTAYLTSCGECAAAARQALQAALTALTDAIGCAERHSTLE
ncbi:MAG: hypothetical protein ABSB60_11455 [Terracidiphilus sp.]|jgi:bacterioferritin-associated ferredoxin